MMFEPKTHFNKQDRKSVDAVEGKTCKTYKIKYRKDLTYKDLSDLLDGLNLLD